MLSQNNISADTSRHSRKGMAQKRERFLELLAARQQNNEAPLTRKAWAELLGVSPRTIGRWIQGASKGTLAPSNNDQIEQLTFGFEPKANNPKEFYEKKETP